MCWSGPGSRASRVVRGGVGAGACLWRRSPTARQAAGLRALAPGGLGPSSTGPARPSPPPLRRVVRCGARDTTAPYVCARIGPTDTAMTVAWGIQPCSAFALPSAAPFGRARRRVTCTARAPRNVLGQRTGKRSFLGSWGTRCSRTAHTRSRRCRWRAPNPHLIGCHDSDARRKSHRGSRKGQQCST